MSLSERDIAYIAQLDVPVLCLDTCILLDIIRDGTTKSTSPSNAIAAKVLVEAAEPPQRLIVLAADLIEKEMNDNLPRTEEDSEKAVATFVKQAKRIHEVAVAYGAGGTLDVSHLQVYGMLAKAILLRWIHVAMRIPRNDVTDALAFKRVMDVRAPAVKGKDSLHDCMIVESYLAAARRLREAGLEKPIVFVSSNTKEFRPDSAGPPADLADDFGAVGITYQPNLSAAMHALGLTP